MLLQYNPRHDFFQNKHQLDMDEKSKVYPNISHTILSQKWHVSYFIWEKCMKLFSNFLMWCEQTTTEKCFIKWHWLPRTDYQAKDQHNNSVNICTGRYWNVWVVNLYKSRHDALWILHNDTFYRRQESQEVWRYFENMTSMQ